jgi:transaldolase
MKIFLDTAYAKDIDHWLAKGVIDGITTNPSNLAKEGGEPTKTILEIVGLMPDKDISVEVTHKAPDAVYRQALAIAKLGKNIVVKIPCHKDYYAIIKKLVEQGIRVNVTLLFTLAQGLFMSKLGVTYISPFIGRWDDLDVEGSELLYALRDMIDRYNYTTEILAASIRHVRHIHTAIASGADVMTMPPSVLEKATDHLLTERGIEIFDNDWKKNSTNEFPELLSLK